MSDESNKVLQALIDSGAFSPEQVQVLRAVKDRSPQRVSYKDTRAVCLIVHKKLRGP